VADPNGGVRIGGYALKLVKPLHLLGTRVGDEQRREQTPEGREAPPPPHPDERFHQLRLLAVGLRGIAHEPAARKRREQDEVADPIRMTRRVGDRHRASLRYPDQRDALQPSRIDDGSPDPQRACQTTRPRRRDR
jgi:hypothetical protein